ncbi:transcription factor hey [Sarcoptes scabiei]|nr:transcription factor hey [Sarcoptes scabiei]
MMVMISRIKKKKRSMSFATSIQTNLFNLFRFQSNRLRSGLINLSISNDTHIHTHTHKKKDDYVEMQEKKKDVIRKFHHQNPQRWMIILSKARSSSRMLSNRIRFVSKRDAFTKR